MASAASQPCGIRASISLRLTGSTEAKRIASHMRSCSATGGASNRLSPCSALPLGAGDISFSFSISSDILLILASQLDRRECLGLSDLGATLFHQFQRGREG